MSELSQSNYITKDLPNSRIHQTILHKIKIGVNFELINNKLLGKPTIFIFLSDAEIDSKFRNHDPIPQTNTKGDYFYSKCP